MPGALHVRRRADSVVRHLDLEGRGAPPQYDLSSLRAGVAKRVRQGFLNDPVRRDVEPGSKRMRVALDDQIHCQTRLAKTNEEVVELGKAGLGAEGLGL